MFSKEVQYVKTRVLRRLETGTQFQMLRKSIKTGECCFIRESRWHLSPQSLQ